MLHSYHTHTSRCKHADGTDEEYVIKAIAEGVRVLGFSDHAPYIYPEGYESYYKMLPSEAAEYFASIRGLAEKYEDKIKILIGYEAEYYPELWDKTLDFWREGDRPDYLILGQHYITEEYATSAVHSMTGTDDPAMMKRYVDLILDGVNTGRFTYVAHPDVISFRGDISVYDREMKRMLSALKEREMPIEINLLGIHEKRNYPSEHFFALAREYELPVILGCDAHSPSRVADKDEIKRAREFADRLGLRLVDNVKIVDPFAVDG